MKAEIVSELSKESIYGANILRLDEGWLIYGNTSVGSRTYREIPRNSQVIKEVRLQ